MLKYRDFLKEDLDKQHIRLYIKKNGKIIFSHTRKKKDKKIIKSQSNI